MAVDETLLDYAVQPWTLRLYGWRRPTVSVGHGQPLARGFDEARGRAAGIDVVRRLTGGRAVLHADELTYSIAAPADDGPLAGGISHAYRTISTGLQLGLEGLGARLVAQRAVAAPAPTPSSKGPCFSARTRHELSFDGRKLVGSAQRRHRGRLLQHGSLLLGPPVLRQWSVLGEGYEAAAAASVGLCEVLGYRPARRRVVAAISAGVAEALGMPLRYQGLAVGESRQARGLLPKYASKTWTSRL